jgi:hypothetical protein
MVWVLYVTFNSFILTVKKVSIGNSNTDKKEKKIFLKNKEIQSGAVAKS